MKKLLAENKKRIVDVFSSSKKGVLSLKKKVMVIHIDPDKFKEIIHKIELSLGYFFTSILILIILVISFHGKANITRFYPANCLGGWENPEYAQRIPEVKSNEDINDFSPENSAVLNNASGQIFCGKFEGEIPTETLPKKLVLRFSLHMTDSPIPEKMPFDLPPVIEEKEPTALPLEENAIQDITEIEEIIPVENFSVEESSTEEPAPPPEPTLPSEPEQPLIENPPTEEPAPEPEPPASESPISFLIESFKNISLVAQVIDALPEENLNQNENIKNEIVEIKPQEEINLSEEYFEVSYTIDGKEWISLGKIGKENLENPFFEIPLEDMTWKDIAKVQISLTSLPLFDQSPIFYLDGMWFETEYEEKEPVDTSGLPKISLKAEVIDIMDGNESFGTNDDAIFTIVDPMLSTYEVAQLINEKKAELIEDKKDVLKNAEETKEEKSKSENSESGADIWERVKERISDLMPK
ncbi:MAG: hypothetical protein WC662_01135, partial [Candidatus Paceibacterota bacterium]